MIENRRNRVNLLLLPPSHSVLDVDDCASFLSIRGVLLALHLVPNALPELREMAQCLDACLTLFEKWSWNSQLDKGFLLL
jgi:hypothetical protein